MSLAEVLASKAVDKRLDDIFKSSAGPSIIATSKARQEGPCSLKRKAEGNFDNQFSRKAFDGGYRTSASKIEDQGRHHDSKGKAKQHESEEEDGDENDENGASSDDDGEGSAIPEHETLKRRKKASKGPKRAKYAPEGETQEQRDARTLFIGNLPVAVVKSKPLKKQLKRHILSHVPSAKVESMRFRSVAFRNPTTTLLDEGDVNSLRQDRQHRRAAEWRTQHSDPVDQPLTSKRDHNEFEEDKKGEKNYMTPAEKRRLAAIKGEVHEYSSATTNAYIVFAYPKPLSSDRGNIRSHEAETMDPFAAAREAVCKIHRTMFADRMLRVDLAGMPSEAAQDTVAPVGIMTDPRLSIFVGNLDFASSEDDAWTFFENIMCEERGRLNNEEDGNSPGKHSWVTRVRIVRDSETQLGKGFAYVQFSDRDCVNEVLALEAERLKFAKRTLRVQRCKTAPALAAAKAKPVQASISVKRTTRVPITKKGPSLHTTPMVVPKGDPSLGTRLADLPKEERKKAKAADPTRVARRLAKKEARMTIGKSDKLKNRTRERKDKKKNVNPGRKEGKRRERSERNAERRNVKK